MLPLSYSPSSISHLHSLINSITSTMATRDVLAGQISASSRVDMLDHHKADHNDVKAWGAPITQPSKLLDSFLTFANDPEGTDLPIACQSQISCRLLPIPLIT